MKSTIAKASTLLLALGLSSVLYANEGQTNSTQAPTAPQTLPATAISDSNLEKFAAVQGDLESIRQEYSVKLENTNDPEQAAALQQEAAQTMVQAVQSTGLKVDTYTQIAQTVNSDPALRARVMKMMN
jgi:glycerophosphoryl diester phosphodiesterase